MKLDVVLTRREFEAAVLAALNVYGKAEIDGLYLRADGGIECTVRTIEETVHSSRSCNPTDVEQGPVDLSTPGVTRLWTPDPPPFIRTVEAADKEDFAEFQRKTSELPDPRPWKEITSGWWPPQGESHDWTSKPCACTTYRVYPEHGWVADGNLHTKEHCEGVEVKAEPPAVSAAASLSASSTGEHGTVESSDEDRIPF